MVTGATRRAEDMLPPNWFIEKGYYMELAWLNLPAQTLRIEGSAAHVSISPFRPGGETRWKVGWEVGHGSGEAFGTSNMSDGELSRCFGLHDGLGATGAKVVNRMLLKFDAAEQGVFVREGNYLNIPGPAATGLPGDPCVSVFLTDKIKNAVKELIIASRK